MSHVITYVPCLRIFLGPVEHPSLAQVSAGLFGSYVLVSKHLFRLFRSPLLQVHESLHVLSCYKYSKPLDAIYDTGSLLTEVSNVVIICTTKPETKPNANLSIRAYADSCAKRRHR